MHNDNTHTSRVEEVTGPLAQVLASLASGSAMPFASTSTVHPSSSSHPFAAPELDMDVIMEAFTDDSQQNQPELTMSHMSRTLLGYMNGEIDSEESELEEQPAIRLFDEFHTGIALDLFV